MSDNLVLSNTLSVTKDENILVITDDPAVGEFFSDEANIISAFITVVLLSNSVRPISHLPRNLKAAIENSNVILTVFRSMPGELLFRKEIITAVEKTRSARLAHMPNVDMDIITNCIRSTDYQELRKVGVPLIEVLARAQEAKVKTNTGTDLSFDLGGWRVRADAGFEKIESRGAWDNLPTGEVFKVPVEKSVNGILVIDGSIPGKALAKDEKITLHIREGEITEIDDRSNSGFKEYLKKIDSGAPAEEKRGIYKICEFGIGINRNARKVSKPVEYEKKLGTAHFAVGDNTMFHGNIKAPEHLDLMFELPTIYINNTQIMNKGEILYDNLRMVCEYDLRNYKPQRKAKITKKTRLYPTMDFGTAEIEDDLLYRHWLAPGKSLFKTLVGNKDTARLAARTWSLLRDGNICFQELVEKLERSREECDKLVRILYDFYLIEISND